MFAIVQNNTITMLVPAGTAFELDGVQYPANWCNLSAPEDKAAIGMVDVIYGPAPSDTYYWVTQEAPALVNGQVVVNYTSTPKDLDQTKASAQAQIDDRHATVITKLVGSPTQTEKDTWTMKLETASSIEAGSEPTVAGKTFLSSAGITTKEEQQDWAKSVIGKSTAYASIVGVGEKLRSTARQAIKQATTIDEVIAALQASIEQTEAAVNTFLKQ
jgi:hypothetical protein